MNSEVDAFLERAKNWKSEMTYLRKIALDCGLTEELKWRQPCYTYNGKNIIIIGAFKEFCVYSFFKGALLQDKEKLLAKQGENVQSARVFQITSVDQIKELEQTIKEYTFEAIEVEKAGLQVEKKTLDDYDVPTELTDKMNEDANFKSAFDNLTPGRRKAYILHFSGAKQSATRVNRIEKYTPRILKGKGINDCVCGHSKRMPNCDGSHKKFE